METINIRRSIRTFTDKVVEQEKIEKLLRAGMQAPSARNQQPWEFIVIRNQESKKELSKVHEAAKPVELANVIILVLNRTDAERPMMVDQDMGACTQNILLEVAELGLGAVWIGVKNVPERMEFVAKTLNLPKTVEAFAIIAIGYSETENKYIDRYDESRVHVEKY